MQPPGTLLYTEVEIAERVRELGGEIREAYAGRVPVLIGVLRGVTPFLADLIRAIDAPLRIDFLAISAYGSGTGVVRLQKDLDQSIEGQDVLLVEDVIDTGLTLRFLLRHLAGRRPASLRICTLFDKPAHRLANLSIDYIGFQVPDQFIVGYGLDDRQLYRNLPDVWVVESPSER